MASRAGLRTIVDHRDARGRDRWLRVPDPFVGRQPRPRTARRTARARRRRCPPDGRFTAFLSSATNLVPGDTNGVVDVFVRDNFAGTTTRVSTTSTGAQLTVPSADPSISDDGRYVAFVTTAPLVAADNLVVGDGDVYVKDRQTGAVTWASVRAGSLALVGDCLGDEISGDGAMVAFHCNEMFPVGEGVFVTRPAGPWVRDLRFASTSGPYTSPSISGGRDRLRHLRRRPRRRGRVGAGAPAEHRGPGRDR